MNIIIFLKQSYITSYLIWKRILDSQKFNNQNVINISQLSQEIELVLINQGFISIEPNAFELLPKLKTLDLSENKIQTLNRSLDSLHCLQFVNLRNNDLENIPMQTSVVDCFQCF